MDLFLINGYSFWHEAATVFLACLLWLASKVIIDFIASLASSIAAKARSK